MANHGERLLEKHLRCFPIPFLTQARIHQVSIGINGTREITPFSPHLHVRFIHLPRLPNVSASFGPQLLSNQWSKAPFPLPNSLIRTYQTPIKNHFSEISRAQLVPEPPQDNEKDHISGIFQESERRPCTLVEKVLASGTTEQAIAECGLLALFLGSG
jgi:hypothetical protein